MELLFPNKRSEHFYATDDSFLFQNNEKDDEIILIIYMEQQYSNRSMCTSLQSIVNFYDKGRIQKDIQMLFKPKPYPKFELQEFYRHELYQKNQQFNFFIDILEQWNRKIDKQQLPNCSDTLYLKNIFVYNTLRNSIMQNLTSSQKVLKHLYSWFNTTRNKNIQPVQRKSRDSEQFDEDWLVRNTFKSNLPAEIDLYRRRYCGNFQVEKNLPETKTRGPSQARKVKTENWVNEEAKELEAKRKYKIQNDVIRFQREAQELLDVHKKWKIKKARDQEGGIKNFYKANFSSCKTYFPKRKSEKQNKHKPNFSSLTRAKTSLGVRSRSGNKLTRLSEGDDVENTTKRSTKQIGFFDEFQDVRLSDINGIRLLSNPQEIKLKKKKRGK